MSDQLGEPPVTAPPGEPACSPRSVPPIFGDCWYNCTLDDVSNKDKRLRLRKVVYVVNWSLPYVFAHSGSGIVI